MRPDDAEFAQLLTKFIPVRITSFKGVDMNFFRFDYDQTFAVLLMDANGTTYSRFGSNDHKLDAARMSITGLKRAMRGALAMHHGGWKPVSPVNQPPRQKEPFTLSNIPAYATSKAADQACAKCHYANTYRFTQLRRENKFSKEMLFQYPFPENLGVTLDVDVNNAIKTVLADSPAQKSGVKPGDILVKANEAPVLTSADLQAVLQDIPDPGEVSLVVERQGKQLPPMRLELPSGWRKSDISWRPSQDGIPPVLGLWGETLTPRQKEQQGIASNKMALRITFFFPGQRWAEARRDLKMGDIILDVNHKELPAMNMRQLITYFRFNFQVGETATLTVLRGGQKMEITVPCIDS